MALGTGSGTKSRLGEDLDPEIRAFVKAMGAAWAGHPGLDTATPAEARRIAEIVRAPWARGGPAMAEVSEHHVPAGTGPVRVRCYDPGGEGPKPGLVYLHGGGWTIFSLDTHDRLMRELAARAGVTVVGVDYAMSPEAKYPVALDQVCAVLRHLAAHGAELGIDPSRLAVGGDSAGGNLSVAACLKLRDSGSGALVSAMALLYGVFDRRSSPEAVERFGGVAGLQRNFYPVERLFAVAIRPPQLRFCDGNFDEGSTRRPHPAFASLGTPLQPTSYAGFTDRCAALASKTSVTAVDFTNTMIVTLRRHAWYCRSGTAYRASRSAWSAALTPPGW